MEPSTDVAKGFGGAVSGDQIHHLGDGKSYAYVSEFNAYTNGTKCSHGDVSPQCSGVLLTRDGGYTYEHIDWGGTDGAGTDASSGAFPSPDVWYVAGGFVQSCSGGPLCFKAYITKTTDGGKTFKTVHNVTATAADAGAGVGSMTDISCVDEDTCFAVSACDQTACADGIYASNHSHGYGGYIHRTTDGGDDVDDPPLRVRDGDGARAGDLEGRGVGMWRLSESSATRALAHHRRRRLVGRGEVRGRAEGQRPPRALDAPRRLDRLRDDVQHAVELLRRLQVRAGGDRVRRRR